MPVWHGVTEELRREEALVVIGITQEQHPARCRLFAQWQGFDWPILWDPFNLTGAKAVPGVYAVDEFGIVRKSRLDPRRVDDELIGEFLMGEFDEPSQERPAPSVQHSLLGSPMEGQPRMEQQYAQFLWGPSHSMTPALERLEEGGLKPAEADPAALFRAGVAYRMRYDSGHAQAGDFQRSLDLWSAALARDPNQYIWRRRIQQYGPRLDKPYPFYDWVERAKTELRARGEEPVELRVPLTGAELARPSNELPSLESGDRAPDPDRAIDLDRGELVTIEGAAAMHTASAGARVRQPGSARVHLALRPNPLKDVHWTNDAGPTVVWVMVPKDWRTARHLYRLEMPEAETSSETRRLDFELSAPQDWRGPAKVRGYALYYVCEGTNGECVYRRQDFVVELGGGEGGGEEGR